MSTELYNSIGEELRNKYQTSIGQLFGKPCLKTSNKAFASFFMEEMVFKLGRSQAEQVNQKYPGTVNWDPSGKERRMKDWFQIPAKFKNDWKDLSCQAMRFVEENK